MSNSNININFLKLNSNKNFDIPLPKYMTKNSSGMDIYAAVENEIIINPNSIKLIPTGFALELPNNFEAQIRPRSGLAIKGISIINSPGTIDPDYRGEILIPLINFGEKPATIKRKDRIAQMIISKIYRAKIRIVNKISKTTRGNKGFGHTGI